MRIVLKDFPSPSSLIIPILMTDATVLFASFLWSLARIASAFGAVQDLGDWKYAGAYKLKASLV